MSSDCGWRGDRARAARRGVSAEPATRVYGNVELGVRFEIDGSFVDDPHRDPAPGLPGNVRSVSLSANAPDGRQAMLSISRVEAGYRHRPRSSPSSSSSTTVSRLIPPSGTAGRSTPPGRPRCWPATRRCTATTSCRARRVRRRRVRCERRRRARRVRRRRRAQPGRPRCPSGLRAAAGRPGR